VNKAKVFKYEYLLEMQNALPEPELTSGMRVLCHKNDLFATSIMVATALALRPTCCSRKDLADSYPMGILCGLRTADCLLQAGRL